MLAKNGVWEHGAKKGCTMSSGSIARRWKGRCEGEGEYSPLALMSADGRQLRHALLKGSSIPVSLFEETNWLC